MRCARFWLFLAVGVSFDAPVGAPLNLDNARGQDAIVVSAAVSLTDALQEVGKAYEAGGGTPVRFNFAASNVLARQIANGAPADLFISADEAQMDYVERAGGIDRMSRIPLLGNRLAVIVPPGRPLPGAGVQAMADSRVNRIAIGDPAAVPAGVYAKRYLEGAGLWTVLQGKLLPLASVRSALAAVESRGADAGIVYETDVAAARVQLAFVIADRDAPRIVYPAAIVAGTRRRASAEKFLSFLRSVTAREVFMRFKFSVLGDPPTHGAMDPGPPGSS